MNIVHTASGYFSNDANFKTRQQNNIFICQVCYTAIGLVRLLQFFSTGLRCLKELESTQQSRKHLLQICWPGQQRIFFILKNIQ